jgi:hypothetical protein
MEMTSFHLDFSTLEIEMGKATIGSPGGTYVIQPIIFLPFRLESIPDLASRFREYTETWRRQTQHLSSVAKMVSHHAYLAIIDMGHDAIPLLLIELRDRPDHWFVALNRITNEDPVPPGSTFGEAVEAWLAWGRKKGYLR